MTFNRFWILKRDEGYFQYNQKFTMIIISRQHKSACRVLIKVHNSPYVFTSLRIVFHRFSPLELGSMILHFQWVLHSINFYDLPRSDFSTISPHPFMAAHDAQSIIQLVCNYNYSYFMIISIFTSTVHSAVVCVYPKYFQNIQNRHTEPTRRMWEIFSCWKTFWHI